MAANRLGYLSIAFVLVGCFVGTQAQEESDEQANHVPADVETIVSGGFWREGQRDGRFRLVVKIEGWEHLANRVFLEWIEEVGDLRTAKVVKALPVKELNSGHWRVDTPRFEFRDHQWMVICNAQPTYGEDAFSVTIKPKEEFRYEFKKWPTITGNE